MCLHSVDRLIESDSTRIRMAKIVHLRHLYSGFVFFSSSACFEIHGGPSGWIKKKLLFEVHQLGLQR